MEMNMDPVAQELMQAFRHFGRASWQQHRAMEGGKSSEIMTLFCIRKHTQPGSMGMKVSEISGLLQVTSPTVTQLINSLEEQGLVERTMDPSDRRAVRVRLTAKGEEAAGRRAVAVSALFNGLVAHLGEEESRQLASLLNKSREYFSEKSEAAAAAKNTREGGEKL